MWMKTMTCSQLGGACEREFHAETFEEMAELSRSHGMEMYREQDADHLEAMQRMQRLTQDAEEMNRWFETKRREFESLPET